MHIAARRLVLGVRLGQMSAHGPQVIRDVDLDKVLLTLFDRRFHVLVAERLLKDERLVYGDDVRVAVRQTENLAVLHEVALICARDTKCSTSVKLS